MRRFAALAVLAAGTFCVPATPVVAHDTDDIIEKCTTEVRTTVRRLKSSVAEDVERCTRAIKRYKAAGQPGKARRVARNCIERINEQTRAAHEHVQSVCARCVHILLEFGEVEAAERFRAWCGEKLQDIERIGKRGRRAIREALDC